MTSALSIRFAAPDDLDAIIAFIRELAEYERLAHEVTLDRSVLASHLFGPSPRAEVLIAEVDAEARGFALFFHNFSTFVGKPGLYLEDLYVRPAARGHGIGRALFARLAALALERDCGRVEWWVLDWNEPALRFYQSLGAVPMNEWTVQRLDGDALRQLAASARL